jgi:hypothetical protein
MRSHAINTPDVPHDSVHDFGGKFVNHSELIFFSFQMSNYPCVVEMCKGYFHSMAAKD